MVTMYDVVIETLPQELIAFRAVVEPRLMQAIREATTSETPTAWIGMFQPGVTLQLLAQEDSGEYSLLTLEMNTEPGSPRSRANDHICREAVATSLMHEAVSRMTTIATMVLVAA